jgi:crotonobetainyl-CoA:carnitine CoA-transferase CaiB-like acyl-CoA transferase
MVQRGVKHCCDQLDAAGVPAAPVQTIDKVMTDPQTLARGMVVEQEHPVLGKVKLPNLPFRFSDCDTAPSGVAPLLGQHNRDIATQLGYAQADIDALVNQGVLYSEDAVGRLVAKG